MTTVEEQNCRRAVFVMLLFVSVSGLGYHCFTLITKYLENPVLTQITQNARPSVMPHIMLCNPTAVVYGINVHHEKEMLLRMKHNNKDFTPKNCPECMANGLWPNGKTDEILATWKDDDTIRYLMGVSFEELVLRCRRNGNKRCHGINFQYFRHDDYLNCYRMIPEEKLSDMEVEVWVKGAEPGVETEGLIVFLYPNGSYPHDKYKLVVGAGMDTSIKLTQTDSISLNLPTKRCLEEKKMVTYSSLDGKKLQQYEYSQEDCILREHLLRYVETCGCLPAKQMPPEVMRLAPFCLDHHDERNANRTYGDELEHFHKKARNVISAKICIGDHVGDLQRFKNSLDVHLCPPKCRTQRYQKEITSKICHDDFPFVLSYRRPKKYTKFKIITDSEDEKPRKSAKVMMQMEHKEFVMSDEDFHRRQNDSAAASEFAIQKQKIDRLKAIHFAKLRISIEPHADSITETRAYEFFQLMSDIGGISGVYLGVSALTLLDLWDMLILRLKWYCNKRRGNGQSDPSVLPLTSRQQDNHSSPQV